MNMEFTRNELVEIGFEERRFSTSSAAMGVPNGAKGTSLFFSGAVGIPASPNSSMTYIPYAVVTVCSDWRFIANAGRGFDEAMSLIPSGSFISCGLQ